LDAARKRDVVVKEVNRGIVVGRRCLSRRPLENADILYMVLVKVASSIEQRGDVP